MTGGVSHVDTFDPKPFLNKNHDKPKTKGRRYYKGSGWDFKKYGQCGTEFSDLFPHIGGMADDICMIRSMQNINGDHFGATIGLHTGSDTFNIYQDLLAKKFRKKTCMQSSLCSLFTQ